MIEFASDNFRLAGIVVEMLLLAGHFEVAATGKVAINRFFAHELLNTIDRCQGRGVHALGALAAVICHEPVHPQLETGEHHAAVARTGAPAESPVKPAPMTATSACCGGGCVASVGGISAVVSQKFCSRSVMLPSKHRSLFDHASFGES